MKPTRSFPKGRNSLLFFRIYAILPIRNIHAPPALAGAAKEVETPIAEAALDAP